MSTRRDRRPANRPVTTRWTAEDASDAPWREDGRKPYSPDIRWSPQLVEEAFSPVARLRRIEPSSCLFSIDKLSLTFDTLDEAAVLAAARARGLPRWLPPYRYSLWCADAVLVQVRSLFRRRSCRLEFHPRALGSRAARKVIRAVLAHALRPSIRVTRIDLAVDVPCSIRDVQALGARQRSVGWYFDDRGFAVETIYSGVRGAALQFATYNKVAERARVGETWRGPPTRIEARVRLRNCAPRDLLRAVGEPFASLRVFLLRPDVAPATQRRLVRLARVVGLPVLKRRLPPERLDALLDAVEVGPADLRVPHPHRIYEERWPAEARRLLGALSRSQR